VRLRFVAASANRATLGTAIRYTAVEPTRIGIRQWSLRELAPCRRNRGSRSPVQDYEETLVLLCELLAMGDITQTEVDTWPLFDRLRLRGSLPRPGKGPSPRSV
jgi:hypothetical protein